MIFNYQALESSGKNIQGSIEAVTLDVAIGSLQKRGLIVINIDAENKDGWLSKLGINRVVPSKEIVLLSKQMATLFEAQISPLKIFTLLASESTNPILRKSLDQIVSDIQGGKSISHALEKHPAVFSTFYVNMVRSGEETGKLADTFNYLAGYLERNYEVASKVKNSLIYPAFVISVFLAVMLLMFTVIIPKISVVIEESGQAVPFYTRIIFSFSHFLVSFGFILLALLIVGVYFLYRYLPTVAGRSLLAHLKLEIPYLGDLYRKLYLSVITDNMHTMILSGIPMVKAIEITATVVENEIYKAVLAETLSSVKGGKSLSDSLAVHPEIPSILVQMVKVGEETGELGGIFKSMARFYQRGVINAVDTVVSLIEPAMIVFLGLSVSVLLASVLIPIYNLASSAGV
ncbi:MAG TPA: type II secretion system F family protein [Candidatus Paceibacterota bacterium]